MWNLIRTIQVASISVNGHGNVYILCSFPLRVFFKMHKNGNNANISPHRRVLELESEVKRGPCSIPTVGNILSLDFFYVVKPLVPMLALLPTLFHDEKPRLNGPVPNVKIVKNLSLVALHCTFIMYWPRVHSISQWSSLFIKEDAAPPGQFIALKAIEALNETISEKFIKNKRLVPPHIWGWRNPSGTFWIRTGLIVWTII